MRADRIAHTARAALRLLQPVGTHVGYPASLAWTVPLEHVGSAIEVYPAATLAAHRLNARGYKAKHGLLARHDLTRALEQHITLPEDQALLAATDHALDVVICVQAGLNFLRGQAISPTDEALAHKEDWI